MCEATPGQFLLNQFCLQLVQTVGSMSKGTWVTVADMQSIRFKVEDHMKSSVSSFQACVL